MELTHHDANVVKIVICYSDLFGFMCIGGCNVNIFVYLWVLNH
jgi:hypothetical protein